MHFLKTKFSADVSWNIISLLIIGTSGLLLNFTIARYLGTNSLGVFNQVFAIYIIISQFSSLGLHLSVLKETSCCKGDTTKINSIISSALLLSIVISAIVGVLTYVSKDIIGVILNSQDVAFGVGLIAPGLVFFSVNKLLINTLNGLNIMKSFAIFQSLRFIFIFLSMISIIKLNFSYLYIPASLSVGEMILFILLFPFIHFRVSPINLYGVSMMWIRKHYLFGLRGFMGGALTEINTRLDILTLGLFVNDSLIGIYSFAVVLAEHVSQIPIVVRRMIDSMLGSAIYEKKFNDIHLLSLKIKKYFFPLMILIGLTAVIIYPYFIDIFVQRADFHKGRIIFILIIMGVVLGSRYRPFLGILIQGGKPGIHTVMVLTLVLFNLIGNLIMIPWLGIMGAGIVTSIVFVLEGVLLVIFTKKYLGITL